MWWWRALQDDIKEYLTSKKIKWEESTDLMQVASECDVVYQTRIQRERFGDRIELYNEARGKYIVDEKVMAVLPKHAVVMHPLPRLDEVRLPPVFVCVHGWLLRFQAVALASPPGKLAGVLVDGGSSAVGWCRLRWRWMPTLELRISDKPRTGFTSAWLSSNFS